MLDLLRRIQTKYVGHHGKLGGCPVAEVCDPEPEPDPELDQEDGVSRDGGRHRLQGRGPPRRRLGNSAEFMNAEIAKLKEINGEDYEPSADDIDRIRAALVAQR